MVRDMIDTIKPFKNKQTTKSMSVDDQKDTINMAIQQQIVKNYINREAGLSSNLDKIYGLIWSQLSHGIKSMFETKNILKRSQTFLTVYGYLKKLRK